jgi:uncharacterized membrane protein YbhN (UPF0104 family)
VRRRAMVLGLGVGLPLSGLFLWLAVRGVDLSAVRRTLRAADVVYVAGAVAGMAVVYVVQALRWRVIACGDASRGQYVRLVVAGVAANNVLPGRLGDGLRGVWLARVEGISSGRALATVVFDRAADVIALVALLAVSLPFTVRPGWLIRIGLGGIGLVVVVVGVLVAARLGSRMHERGDRARSRGRRVARDLLDGLSEPPSPGRAAVALAWSLVAWVIWSLAAWLAARSLRVELSPTDALLVAGVINLGVAIPSSPGFVGTYQWLGVSTLSLLGVDREKALSFSILLHAVWYVPTTVAGGAILLARLVGRAHGGSGSRLVDAAAEERP